MSASDCYRDMRCVREMLEGCAQLVADAYSEDALHTSGKVGPHSPTSLFNRRQRYYITETGADMIVSMPGTTHPLDWGSNMNVGYQPVLESSAKLQELSQAQLASVPCAHRGFLTRSKSVPAMELYQQAAAAGKRLVFTGHSLGGAIAAMCTLEVLLNTRKGTPAGASSWIEGSSNSSRTANSSSWSSSTDVVCCVFACPIWANAALSEYIEQQGWGWRFSNVTVPEDFCLKLFNNVLTSAAKRSSSSSEQSSEETWFVKMLCRGDPGPSQPMYSSSSSQNSGSDDSRSNDDGSRSSSSTGDATENSINISTSSSAVDGTKTSTISSSTAASADMSPGGSERQDQLTPYASLDDEDSIPLDYFLAGDPGDPGPDYQPEPAVEEDWQEVLLQKQRQKMGRVGQQIRWLDLEEPLAVSAGMAGSSNGITSGSGREAPNQFHSAGAAAAVDLDAFLAPPPPIRIGRQQSLSSSSSSLSVNGEDNDESDDYSSEADYDGEGILFGDLDLTSGDMDLTGWTSFSTDSLPPSPSAASVSAASFSSTRSWRLLAYLPGVLHRSLTSGSLNSWGSTAGSFGRSPSLGFDGSGPVLGRSSSEFGSSSLADSVSKQGSFGKEGVVPLTKEAVALSSTGSTAEAAAAALLSTSSSKSSFGCYAADFTRAAAAAVGVVLPGFRSLTKALAGKHLLSHLVRGAIVTGRTAVGVTKAAADRTLTLPLDIVEAGLVQLLKPPMYQSIGQQWVLTSTGLLPQQQPIAEYPCYCWDVFWHKDLAYVAFKQHSINFYKHRLIMHAHRR